MTAEAVLDLPAARAALDERGFVVLPGFLSRDDLAAAVAELPSMYPTADEFHDDVDPERNAPFRAHQFAGLRWFPFDSTALSLLCVHDKLLDLSEALLGTEDLRIYNAEAWAKYTGAVDYDQGHHRDFGNHTILVPSDDLAFRQLELFVYLDDVTDGHGPTHAVPTSATADLPLWVAEARRDTHAEVYDAEESAVGPAGTVLAYTTSTFHRGTNMHAPRGARFTIHLNFRAAAVEWAQRRPWVDAVSKPAWHGFVAGATPRQLAVFGWPPPGHPYWTAETVEGMAHRYPDRDFTPWRAALGS